MLNDTEYASNLDNITSLDILKDGLILMIIMQNLYPDFKVKHAQGRVAELIFPAIVKKINSQVEVLTEFDQVIKLQEVDQILKVQDQEGLLMLTLNIIKFILILISFDGQLSETKKMLQQFERSNKTLQLFYQDAAYHEIEQRVKMSQSMRSSASHKTGGGRHQPGSRLSENPHQHSTHMEKPPSTQRSMVHDDYDTGDRDSNGTGGHNSAYGRSSFTQYQHQSMRKSQAGNNDYDKMSNGSSDVAEMNLQGSPISSHRSKGYQTTSRHQKYQNRTNQMQREDLGSGQLFRDSESSSGTNRVIIQQLKEREYQLLKSNEKLYLEKQELENIVDDLEGKIEEMSNGFEEMRVQNAALKAEKEVNQKEIDEYTKKKEAREQQMLGAIKKLSAEKMAFTMNISKLTKKFNTVKNDHQKLKTYILQLQQQQVLDLGELMRTAQQKIKQSIDSVMIKCNRQLKEKVLEITDIKSQHEIEIRSLKAKLDMHFNQSQKTGDEKFETLKLQSQLEQAQNECTKERLAKETLALKMKEQQIDLDSKLKASLETLKDIQLENEQKQQAALEKQKSEIEEDFLRRMNQKLSEQKFDLQQQLEERTRKLKEEYESELKTIQTSIGEAASGIQQPIYRPMKNDTTIVEALKRELREKEALLLQVQSEFEDLQQQASKRILQRKKEIDNLKEENEKLRTELEKCVKHFQQQQLRTYQLRETRENQPTGIQRSKSQLLENTMGQDQNQFAGVSDPSAFCNQMAFDGNIQLRSNKTNKSVVSQNLSNGTPDQVPSFKSQGSILQRETESNKSVYQALSQQLQLDDKLNFSGFSQKSSEGGHSNKENKNYRQRSSGSRQEHTDQDDELDPLSFYLSNESSRQINTSIRKTLEEVA